MFFSKRENKSARGLHILLSRVASTLRASVYNIVRALRQCEREREKETRVVFLHDLYICASFIRATIHGLCFSRFNGIFPDINLYFATFNGNMTRMCFSIRVFFFSRDNISWIKVNSSK